MAHECDECGASFETLTRLRLHDCGDVQSDTFSTASSADRSTSTDSSPTEERNASVAELDNLLNRFADGDVDAIHYAVVEFESALSAALKEDTSVTHTRTCFGRTTSASVANSTRQREQTDGHSSKM
jgi:predicted  nucleic acid-binding Zn-ribbon protein